MRKLIAGLCAAVVLVVGAAPAEGATGDPLWSLSTILNGTPPMPVPLFEDPCGLAVDSFGDLYVSNYYRHTIDVFKSPGASAPADREIQITNVDPEDGPCGLAVGPTGDLFVNDFHRDVQKLVPSSYPPSKAQLFPIFVPATTYSPGGTLDTSQPTGVVLDPSATTLYINRRAEVASYDAATGAPLGIIGASEIEDAYGLAVSGYPATAGYLYVPDAASDTVLVFDPATDTEVPVEVIDGADIPAGGFGSLDDSAVAVDNVTGEIYVSDTLGPQLSNAPKATIQVFDATGAYEGQLKDQVVDGAPVGLAVDNSGLTTQSRLYVTSGNAEGASVIAYPPGSAVLPPASPLAGPGGGGSSSSARSPGPEGAPPSPEAASQPQASASAITQKGNLRLKLSGRLAPKSLPRKGDAPISVSVGGEVSTTDQTLPPLLKTLRIELNKEGRLDYAGLPTCPYERIQPASSQRALSACKSSLVGQGSFEADITLSGQEPYPTSGKLLLFNAKRGRKPLLYGQIYAPRPFATSFVIPFEVQRLGKGTYGTALSATLPKAMASWGDLTGIQLTLQRHYSYRGQSHSFISAGCPAPKGFRTVSFPLARASFGFEDGKNLTSTLNGTCKVRD